jgi:hypothetical protein
MPENEKWREVQILLKEYDTLRAEVIARESSGFQLMGAYVALIAAALAWYHGSDHPSWPDWAPVAFFVVLGLGLISFVVWPTYHMGRAIGELEIAINRRLGCNLLSWEGRRRKPVYRFGRSWKRPAEQPLAETPDELAAQPYESNRRYE